MWRTSVVMACRSTAICTFAPNNGSSRPSNFWAPLPRRSVGSGRPSSGRMIVAEWMLPCPQLDYLVCAAVRPWAGCITWELTAAQLRGQPSPKTSWWRISRLRTHFRIIGCTLRPLVRPMSCFFVASRLQLMPRYLAAQTTHPTPPTPMLARIHTLHLRLRGVVTRVRSTMCLYGRVAPSTTRRMGCNGPPTAAVPQQTCALMLGVHRWCSTNSVARVTRL